VDYCKRVLAVGGDVVEFRKNVVFLNGQPLARTRLDQACPGPGDTGPEARHRCTAFEEHNGRHRYRIWQDPAAAPSSFGPLTVPAGHLFVLGDNRDNSNDSRVWGTVPADHVKGRAQFIWWSRLGGVYRWDRIGKRVY
jgi:signal peptidase I